MKHYSPSLAQRPELVEEQVYLSIVDCARNSISGGCTRNHPLCAVADKDIGLVRKLAYKLLNLMGYRRIPQPFCRRYLS